MSTGIYKGQTNCYTRCGNGIYIYAYGYFKYEGQWLNGQKHGAGKLSMKDGSFYEGSFRNGEICGNGHHFYASSGNEYTGNFYMGERHGYGVMTYSDGSIYEGEWFENMQQGEGKFTDARGIQYCGKFKMNKKHGTGILHSLLFTYNGGWFEGEFSGFGTLTLIDGTLFEGMFSNGKPNGKGELTRIPINSPNYFGYWKDGIPCNRPAYMKLSIEMDSETNPNSRRFPMESKSVNNIFHNIISVSKVNISLSDLNDEFKLIVCVYNQKDQLFIEESNRNLGMWLGKRIDSNELDSISDLEFDNPTPILQAMKEQKSYQFKTPFGFMITPMGLWKKIDDHSGIISTMNENKSNLSTENTLISNNSNEIEIESRYNI